MDILEHLKARRTVRKFKPDSIPQEVLDRMYEAAMWAPSHANIQPWEFVVVGPETRGKLLAILQKKAAEVLADPNCPPQKRQNMETLRQDFGGAPYMVAVISRAPVEDLQKLENPLSVAGAVQNMCLAGWEAGVGAVWLSLGAAPPTRGLLQLKEGESVVALLAMGYPEEAPPAPPREDAAGRMRQVP